MKIDKSIWGAVISTTLFLAYFSIQTYTLNLNIFILFIYLLGISFVGYKSCDKTNIYHMSWISTCLSASLYFRDFPLQTAWVALASVSLVIHCFVTGKMRIFKWVQVFSLFLFGLAIWLYNIGDVQASTIVVINALLIRQVQFPFHLWIKEIKNNTNLFPSLLFFIISQTGFVLYAESFLHSFDTGIFSFIIPVLTLATGLLLAVYGLLEKNILTRHLLIIISQSCLPLAAYQSFSSTSATGGILFSLLLAMSGSVFGFLAYHIVVQKKIDTLDEFHSLYRKNKQLASIYFIIGLSIVGLPFTMGYIAEDILFHGLVETSPFLAALYILMTAVNGYTVFHTFNSLFFGHTTKVWSPLYQSRFNKFFVFTTLILVVGGGVASGPLAKGIEKRIVKDRKVNAALVKKIHNNEQLKVSEN